MKHLTITYDGVTLFDGDVNHFQWSEDDGTISVKGGNKPRSGLPQLLSRAAGELAKNGKP